MLRRLTAIVVVALVCAACGARLTDEQVAAANSPSDQSGPAGPVAFTPVSTVAPASGSVSVEGAASGGGGVTDPVAGTGSSGSGASEGDPGSSPTDPAAPADAGTPAQSGSTCTGAEGPGVSDGVIKVSVVSDRTGPIPGLFESTVQAVSGWERYINAAGGLCGMRIQAVPLDSKTDGNQARAATIDACSSTFAHVGGLSAFDQGGAAVVDECGIPDLSAVPTSAERGLAQNTYSPHPNPPTILATGPYQHVFDTMPDAAKKAAMVWVDAGTAEFNARKRMAVLSEIGFEFVVQRPASAVEPNYGPFVVDMKQKGVRYVHMMSDSTNTVRFVDAFKQQNYFPDRMEFDSTIYDKGFLEGTKNSGKAIENSRLFMNIMPVEETAQIPEYQLLQQASGIVPDFYGVYAWSAARLFEDAVNRVDGVMTREKLLAVLAEYGEWDGHGIHGTAQIGAKQPTGCFVKLRAVDAKWVRDYPASGMECGIGRLAPYEL